MTAEAAHAAVRAGDTAALAALLAADPELAGARDATGVSLLLQARYRNADALVALIRAHDPPLDVFDAAALGPPERLVTLLDEDPEAVRCMSADGFGALHLAAFFAQPEQARALIARGADVALVAQNGSELRPLNSAVAGGDLEIVRALLDAGAGVDAPQVGGITPLMGAAATGNEALVQLLLERGADPSRSGSQGTAAEIALERGHPELAQRLAGG
jgi:ankyrin repeat protein